MFVVAAEFMGASEGLGFLLIDGQETGRPANIIAAILLFALFGKVSDLALAAIGRRFVAWQDSFEDAEEKKADAADRGTCPSSLTRCRARRHRSRGRSRRDRRHRRHQRLRQEHAAAHRRRARDAERRPRRSRRRRRRRTPRRGRPRLPGAAAHALAQRARQCRVRARRRPRAQRRPLAETALARVGLAASPTRCRSSFRAAWRSARRSPARWSRGREVLLLDEPFSALDAFTRFACRIICSTSGAPISRPCCSSPTTSRRRWC